MAGARRWVRWASRWQRCEYYPFSSFLSWRGIIKLVDASSLIRSGLEVITTCSPRNFDLVKSLGADKVFDYNSPSVGSEIREYTNNRLRHAWDAIGEGESAQICADSLSSESGPPPLHYVTINRTEFPRADVKTEFRLTYTISNETCEVFGGIAKLEPQPQDFEFAKRWGGLAARLFEEKKVIPHPIEVRGGLEDITQGLDDMEAKRVSGKKLVYRVADL
jgi:NADPH:quinone reductase-like Zn-dependent oxidoreductase